MICVGSILKSADNSGAKKIKCIKVLSNSPKGYAKLGQIVIVVVQKLKQKKKLEKKKMYFGLIISLKKKTRRNDGSFLKNDANRVLLLTDTFKFIGTRVYGPICKEIRVTPEKRVRYKRIISYSELTV